MTRTGGTEAKAQARGESGGQGRRLEDRRRLETVVVLAVNDANAVLCLRCRGEIEWGPGESTRASEKFKRS